MMKWLNEQPLWLKIVFALPLINVIWWVARIVLSVEKNNTLGIVLGIILLILGLPMVWLVDLITIIVKGTVLWFDN